MLYYKLVTSNLNHMTSINIPVGLREPATYDERFSPSFHHKLHRNQTLKDPLPMLSCAAPRSLKLQKPKSE